MHDLHRKQRPASRGRGRGHKGKRSYLRRGSKRKQEFEGRVHPLVKFAYLASPPLVVAFAIAGKVGIDLYSELSGLEATETRCF